MRQLRMLFLETVLLAVAGVLLALLANALSPLGLRLSRDYFPSGAAGASAFDSSPGTGSPAALATSTAAISAPFPPAGSAPSLALDATIRRLQQRGLTPVQSNAVVELFRDVRYEQGLVVFLDARDETAYGAGHIPGAWPFHHYRPEQFLPTVLPACLNAQQVVVYCTGGNCEDSEFAALTLRDAGVPLASLLVYPGGIAEWKALGLPVETGARGSGRLLDAKP